MVRVDPELKKWATRRQAEIIDAINEHGGQRQAADALGLSMGTIGNTMQRIKAKAAQSGYSPDHDMTHPAPDGFGIKGVSTLYNQDGEVSAQWVKTTRDAERWAEIQKEAIEALSADIPRVAPVAPPESVLDDLCNLYTMTDCHMGMLAWRKEGGSDWDIDIAERVLTGCFERMVDSAQPAHTGIVNQLGDFLHSDGLLPVTPTSGHVLDQDGRFSKIVGATIRVLRRLVDLALQKHSFVIVLMAEGNHDMASSVWLRHMFKALYENEPRVQVIDTELPYYAVQHGECMIAMHHGHLKKNDHLPLLFAAQYSEMWGATQHRYAHTGHRHHAEEKEHSGMKVIQHPTLAARDAYAARGGYHAARQASGITYHKKYGEVARTTVTPEMLS